MTVRNCFNFILISSLLAMSCTNPKEQTLNNIQQIIDTAKGNFAVAYKNLQTGETIFFNEDTVFHAASTMKTPVMVEIYKNVSDGKWKMSDSVLIKNEFKSIVDGSTYSLPVDSDSQKEFYSQVGQKVTLYDLTQQMIITSSNLATNMLIEWVTPEAIKQTLLSEGIEGLNVLRGVEDNLAFRAGLNNNTTAKALMLFFEALYNNKFTSEEYTKEMLSILNEQKFGEMIPKHLPDDVKVYHKTGGITGVAHDSGIVVLPDGTVYICVILSKNLPDSEVGKATIANISKQLYDFTISK